MEDDAQTSDEIIIMMVSERQHLYRKDLPGYKDLIKTDNSWQLIAEGIDQTVEYTRRRWENLRDRFVRAYRKINEKPPSGSGRYEQQQATVSFPYLQQMMFLAPYLRKRRTVESSKEKIGQPNEKPKPITGNTKEHVGVTEWDTMELLLLPDDSPVAVDEPIEVELFEEDSEDRPASAPPVMSPRKRAKKLQQNAVFKAPPVDDFCTRKRAKSDNLTETLCSVAAAFTKLAERPQVQRPAPAPESSDSGDTAFMKSVVEDMKLLTRANKMKFKRIVLETMEKLVGEEY